MATFIPEWVKVSGSLIHIKRVLASLDDGHVIRRTLRGDKQTADFFVEHPSRGWLIAAVEEASFAEIDPAQLFESAPRSRFEQRLGQLQQMACLPTQTGVSVGTLLIMWSCSSEEVRQLVPQHRRQHGTHFVSREQFSRLDEQTMGAWLTPMFEESMARFRGMHFAETEIPAACTTRRFFRRDNGARLQRYFLDLEQESAAKLDLDLPGEQATAARDLSVRLINGVAGSGKTLIAMSRAVLLAETFPRQKLLMLIHNTPVVADVKERLHRVRGGPPANLEISTFFAWACQQWRVVFGGAPEMPADQRQVPSLVKQARSRWPEIKLSDGQLIDEMDFINQALVPDEAAYLEASRAGRGFALRPREREQVWALYQTVSAKLQSSGLRMWSALPREICLAGSRTERLRKYDHTLIDEAQFFAP